MKHTDLEAHQQHEREDWQKRGIGGLVSAVDPAAGTITIGVSALGSTTNVTVQITKSTVIRRYSPDSVKFDEAKPGTLAEIKPGDQLRARGTRNAAGTEFVAEEIVSGSFRNIAGTVSSIDAAANTVSIMDLITKQSVVVKISSESQVRKLPAEMAQRIAMRMKASAAGAAPEPPAAPQRLQRSVKPTRRRTHLAEVRREIRPGGGGRAPDLQQFLTRLPAATLADLQKGDAVMIVSTVGSASGQVTAITLLAGVEPAVTASPKGAQAMMLSPWSLGGVGDAGAGGDPNP